MGVKPQSIIPEHVYPGNLLGLHGYPRTLLPGGKSSPVLSPVGMGKTMEKTHLAQVHEQNKWKPQDHL